MNLHLLIDEDTQAKRLVQMLREVGFDLVTATEAGIEAVDDIDVLTWAIGQRRSVLTRNCDDFRDLHDANPNHHGVIAIYADRDASKNMNRQSIVAALAALQDSGWELEGQFVALNAWKPR